MSRTIILERPNFDSPNSSTRGYSASRSDLRWNMALVGWFTLERKEKNGRHWFVLRGTTTEGDPVLVNGQERWGEGWGWERANRKAHKAIEQIFLTGIHRGLGLRRTATAKSKKEEGQ